MFNLNDFELATDIALKNAIEFIGKKSNKILKSFGRIYQYSDEVKLYQYYAQLNLLKTNNNFENITASGFSLFSKKDAVLKCLSEALERYALKNIDNALIYSKKSDLDKPSIDLSRIISFSKKQRDKDKNLQFNIEGEYSWVLGKDLFSLKNVYIPTQLVYLTYIRNYNESLIRLPISTGAASGTAYSASIYRGICEIIERDSFMIFYLNKLSPKRVALSKSKNKMIKKILKISKNYNFLLKVFDITTDVNVYTFLTIIYDPTGIGPSISVGLKSDLNPINALIGSISEAFHPRNWLRNEMDNISNQDIFDKNSCPRTLKDRGMLWLGKEMLEKLNFFVNSKNIVVNIDDYKNISFEKSSDNLEKMISILKKSNLNAYFVDITPKLSFLEKSKFNVVMVVIPELHPLHLDEKYPYFGGNRLYEVPFKLNLLKKKSEEINLNKFPHPFL